MRMLALMVATAVLVPRIASAQGVPRLDSTHMTPVSASGKALVYWVTDEGANGEQGIYLRNTSPDRAITITSWEVFDCYRVAGGICGKRAKGPTIKPGKSVRLVLIRGFKGSTEGFSYKYRFEQAWTDELALKNP